MILYIEECVATMNIRDRGARTGYRPIDKIEIDPPGCKGKVHVNEIVCYNKGHEVEAQW